MPIHDLGYRSWDAPPQTTRLRWLVIGKAGIRNAWKNKWLGRSIILLLLPFVFFGAVIFFYEQGVEGGYNRHELIDPISVLGWFRGGTGMLADVVNNDLGSVRHEVWSFLIFAFFGYPPSLNRYD